MGKLTETIYDDGKVLIPMADVQHIEHLKEGGIWVITKHTNWNFEQDMWDNPIYIGERGKVQEFLESYCKFRHEKD